MNKKRIFEAIEQSSEIIKLGKNELERRLKSAKNYVSNETFSEWAFSKLVATENFDVQYGSSSKPFFYSHNFVNILNFEESAFKTKVIKNFLKWAEQVKYVNLKSKFITDQENLKRFELLVHIDLVPKEIQKKQNFSEANQDEFLEGFKKYVRTENSHRDRKLIKLAKEKYGTNCSVCNLSFEEKYGIHGKGFIEIHHLIPIHQGKRKSTIDEVTPVCSNCHRMLHKGETMLTIEYLKEIIESQKTSI